MSTLEELQANRLRLDQKIEAATRRKASAIARITAAMKAEGLVLSDFTRVTKADVIAAAKVFAGNEKRVQTKPKPERKAKAVPADTNLVDKPADKRKKVAVKYADPATGSTWTGRGRPPKWFAAAVANGKTADDFSVNR